MAHAEVQSQAFLARAQERLRSGWEHTRERLTHAHDSGRAEPPADPGEKKPARRFKRPSRKALIITGSVIGAVLVAVLLFLVLFDWNYLRGPISRYASERIGRQVSIEGNLRVKLLSWTPTATVEGLKIGNIPGRSGDMADVRKLTVSVRLAPLFRGKVILPLVQVDQPNVDLFRDAQGRNNWTFKKRQTPGEPTRLPPINRFEINNGKLRIEDQIRRLRFAGVVNSSETTGGRTVQGFKLAGDGTLNAEPFNLDLTGGPLLNVDPDKPYPFDARVQAGDTRIIAKGSITEPFNLGLFRTTLDVTGPDMADLYYLTGLTLPNTPPYSVSGTLTRNNRRYRYDGINGRVGDSDLRGWLGVTTGQRLMLTGDLRSRVLDFDDLNTVIGGAPSTAPGESASAKQKAVASQMRATRRLLPDAPLDVQRLRRMDADVKYRAQSIRSAKFPVRSGSVHVVLERSLLQLEDLTFTLPRGQIAGDVAINARQATPVVDLDMRMTGARVEQFLPAKFAANSVSGALVGRAKLHGVGKSVHAAAATANGNVTVVMPGGEIREAFAELLGVNVVRGLGLLLGKDQEKTAIRCGVADFTARNGVLQANHFVLDTEPVLANGGGTISLRDESLSLRLKGKAKEFRLVRLIAPIKLEGSLGAPKFGVEAGPAVGQAGLAAALGAAIAPLAAILPFVDTGLAKDANCAALLSGKAAPGDVPLIAKK